MKIILITALLIFSACQNESSGPMSNHGNIQRDSSQQIPAPPVQQEQDIDGTDEVGSKGKRAQDEAQKQDFGTDTHEDRLRKQQGE